MTGACGFIGGHLLRHLQSTGWQVKVLSRDAPRLNKPGASPQTLSSLPAELALLSSQKDWSEALESCDVLFHLAGIAHRQASEESLREVNELATLKLARAASEAGVPAFVWLSSIKVLGEISDQPLPVTAVQAPADRYAASKAAAERGLWELAPDSQSRISIVRPPLVYGPGVKANFLALLSLARLALRGLPLPLGQARAPRSLLGVTNLCDFLLRVAEAGEGVLHVADAEDLCVAQVLQLLCQDKGIRLWNLPAGTMRNLLSLVGKQDIYTRLYEPLQLDTSVSFPALDWQPPMSSGQLLQETMSWFLQR